MVKKLSAFLSELSEEQKAKLENQLKDIYPAFKHFTTSSLKSGWKRLSVVENYRNRKLTSEARHINDGMLRVMAIVAQNTYGK